MFKTSSICLGILLTSLSIVDANSNYNQIDDDSNQTVIDVSKISIGGIKLGMREQDLVEILGKPKSIKTEYDDARYRSYVTTWEYNQIKIKGLSTNNNSTQSKVHQITVSSPNYHTEKEVKVGDKIDKAQKTYSDFISQYDKAEDIGENLDGLGYINGEYGGLVFEINKQGIIHKINLLKSSC